MGLMALYTIPIVVTLQDNSATEHDKLLNTCLVPQLDGPQLLPGERHLPLALSHILDKKLM